MSERNDVGPAFPSPTGHPDTVGVDFDYGMSIRDYFAAKAMAGILASKWFRDHLSESGVEREVDPDTGDVICTEHQLAARAYRIADAMLAARDQ